MQVLKVVALGLAALVALIALVALVALALVALVALGALVALALSPTLASILEPILSDLALSLALHLIAALALVHETAECHRHLPKFVCVEHVLKCPVWVALWLVVAL